MTPGYVCTTSASGEIVDQHVVDARRVRAVLDAERGRGVALRVEVDDEHPGAGPGQRCGEVDGGRRLADAALLVRDRQHPSGRGQREHRLFKRDAPTVLVGEFVGQGSSSVIE